MSEIAPKQAETAMLEATYKPITEKLKRWIGPLATLTLFILATIAIRHLLRDINFDRLVMELHSISIGKLTLSVIAALVGYWTLTGYDWTALTYLGRKLSYPLVALASFCGYAVANTVGVSIVSGGAVRYRFYAPYGMSAMDAVKIATICAMSFGIGVHVIGVLALLIYPDSIGEVSGISVTSLRNTAIAIAVIAIASTIYLIRQPGPIRIGKWTFTLPSWQIAVAQLLFSILDITCAAFCFYVLLSEPGIPFIAFVMIYSIALLIGITSHVPGGAGVFESVMIFALRDHMSLETVTAALIVFRGIYYIFPFAVACIILVIREFWERANSRRSLDNKV